MFEAFPEPHPPHSILKSTPAKMNEDGGGWGEGRAYSRAGRSVERTKRVKAATHAARAQSLSVPAKMSSSGVVYCHKTRTQIQILLVFFGGGQRKPMGFGHAARFARMEGKVQAEDFLEGGFFGGEIRMQMLNAPMQ